MFGAVGEEHLNNTVINTGLLSVIHSSLFICGKKNTELTLFLKIGGHSTEGGIWEYNFVG